jgi:hypothetical protein
MFPREGIGDLYQRVKTKHLAPGITTLISATTSQNRRIGHHGRDVMQTESHVPTVSPMRMIRSGHRTQAKPPALCAPVQLVDRLADPHHVTPVAFA